MFLGLGVPEWLLIIGLSAGLWVTFRMMAGASVHYEKARRAREQKAEHNLSENDSQE